MLGEKVRQYRTKVNIGDMDRLILIQNRNIKPSATSGEYYEELTPHDTDNGVGALANGEAWAAVQSVAGVTVFDGVGQEQVVTHVMYVMDLDITSENWILFENNRYDIVKIDPIDSRAEFLKLYTQFKGIQSNFNNVA